MKKNVTDGEDAIAVYNHTGAVVSVPRSVSHQGVRRLLRWCTKKHRGMYRGGLDGRTKIMLE